MASQQYVKHHEKYYDIIYIFLILTEALLPGCTI